MKINYCDVRFDKAFGTAAQLPESTLPEVSFAGRSNVGKSSLINKLFGRKKLAMVSSTPGKTATINFFVSGMVNFVDLPGYGYAQVSKSEKTRWARLIDEYFNQDRRFALVCCLVDIRHDASNLDISMVRFLQHMELPYAIVFTKADKLSNSKAIQREEPSAQAAWSTSGHALRPHLEPDGQGHRGAAGHHLRGVRRGLLALEALVFNKGSRIGGLCGKRVAPLVVFVARMSANPVKRHLMRLLGDKEPFP